MRVCVYIYICIVVFNVYHASSLRNKLYNIISLLAKKVKDLVPFRLSHRHIATETPKLQFSSGKMDDRQMAINV